MKMNPTQLNNYHPYDNINKQTETIQNRSSENDILDKSGVAEPDLSRYQKGPSFLSAIKNDVLSAPEQAMLHGLFGSEKPKEQAFYGPNEIGHIHKGQLMDISG